MHYLIVNETHLKRKGLRQLKKVTAVFESAGADYKIIKTQKEGDAKRYTHEITSSGEKCVVVGMGGDGTVHDILNGIADFSNCAVGLIPFGTGNDFASSANIPKDPVKAAKIIAYGTAKKMDFIQLESGLRSINSVGMGIDVEILKRVYHLKKKGKGKYLRALIYCLRHFECNEFTLKYDGKEEKHFGLISAVGNAKYLGGGIKLFPDAQFDDGWLDLIIVDYISRAKILGAFIKLVLGKVDKIKKVTFVKTKAVEFECAKENFTIQAEGELYDNIPVKAHICEGQLQFFLP